MSYVFISYSRKDKAYVNQLVTDLHAHGFDVWIDTRIQSGDDWWDMIVEALRDCGAFIIVMSPNSGKSLWVRKEMLISTNLEKRAFPLLLAGTDELAKSNQWAFYTDTQFDDVRGGTMPPDTFYDQLAQFVSRKADGIGQTVSEADAAKDLLNLYDKTKTIPFQLKPLETFDLNDSVTTLGRHRGNNIQLQIESVSNVHAMIYNLAGQYMLEDQRSKYGTTVNGVAINAPTILEDGDLIGMGPEVEFEFVDREHVQLVLLRTNPVASHYEGTTRAKPKQPGTHLKKNDIASLRVVRGQQKGHLYPLFQSDIRIGRKNATISLYDPKASRYHAVLVRDTHVYKLRDLGSTNGTEVNDKKLNEDYALSTGDYIKIGDTLMVYEVNAVDVVLGFKNFSIDIDDETTPNNPHDLDL